MNITYHGISVNGVEHFLNIKYAHDTSGSRRFAPPEPLLPKEGSQLDCTVRDPACPQLQGPLPPFFSPEPDISEDCLSLRISRPSGLNITPESKLPVLVWLHGGGVVKRSAYDEHSDPDRLLLLSKLNGQPVMFATINYRLTIFGFAHSRALQSGKSENVGMRDQRAGFQWLKDHVAAFGGDPHRILAFGLSAGGTFISLQHMAFGGIEGVPFDRAFMMSGPLGNAVNQLSGMGVKHTQKVSERLNCGNDDDETMLDCLRALLMQRLLDGAMNYSIERNPPNGLFTFIPEVDGDFLPDRASQLLHEGRFVKGIPSILAWTEDDSALNAGPADNYQTGQDMLKPLKVFFPFLEDKHHKELLELYPASDFLFSRLLRDMLFTCSSLDFTHQTAKHTQLNGDSAFKDVYLYTLNQSVLNPIWDSIGFPFVGASHGSDQNYVFNGVFPEGKLTKSDRALASELSSSVINFAYTGDPASDDRFSQTIAPWPEAYDSYTEEAEELPDFKLQVVGGPHGGSSVRVSQHTAEAGRDQEASTWGQGLQNVVGGVLSYGSMADRSEDLTSMLWNQELHRRCNYIVDLGEWLQN